MDEPGRQAGRRHNLPHVASNFVGRGGDMAEVAALLADRRLVTLTGLGGMGKTRLAIQVAFGMAGQFADGVWMVELAALTDVTLLPEAVAAVLPAPKHHLGPRSIDDLASLIGEQSILLVIDNCEHMVEPCGRLVDFLLRSCPGLRVLATSQELLAVAGEHRWSVGPLSLPGPGEVDASSVRASQAGELFVQRAKASCPGFRLTEAVAPTVADICRRLDGMPLAIELAAARLVSLSPREILQRLDDRFRLLATGSRSADVRHETLAATLEWSHDLLSAPEAVLLRRVSIFADWSLDAAEEVCAGGGIRGDDIVDHLGTLASKSLVIVETPDDTVRYRLLETVRTWARTKLEAASEADVVARRHACWCLDLAERAKDEFGDEPHLWLDRVEAEHENLRAGLQWARTTGDSELGVRLATALSTFWRTRGHLREASGWLEWATAASEQCPALIRANVLRETGLVRGMLGDITSALPLLEESSALFVQAGDHDTSQCACNSMYHMLRQPRESLRNLEEEIDRCRAMGNSNKLAHFLFVLGQAHFLLGEIADARRHFAESVALGRGETNGEALRSGLMGLGRVAALCGDPAAAETAYAEARAKAAEMGDDDDAAATLGLIGDLARSRGEWDRARQMLDESVRLASLDPTPIGMARALYFSARLAAAAGTDGAGDLFTEALSLVRGADGLGFHNARCLLGLGGAAQAVGDHRAAAGRFLEALAIAQAIGDAQATAQALDHLGGLARLDGRMDEAETLAHRGLELHHRIGDVAGMVASLESVAGVAVDGGRWPAAARLLAAAQALLDTAGYARARLDQVRRERDIDRVVAALDEEAFAAALVEGASLAADDAVAYALRGRGARDRPACGWASLTPAERRVASLVGDGLANPEVGRRLFISPRTVGHHLAHVYQKLGIHSRGALMKEIAGLQAADSG